MVLRQMSSHLDEQFAKTKLAKGLRRPKMDADVPVIDTDYRLSDWKRKRGDRVFEVRAMT